VILLGFCSVGARGISRAVNDPMLFTVTRLISIYQCLTDTLVFSTPAIAFQPHGASFEHGLGDQ
jgi:hypothetical protein